MRGVSFECLRREKAGPRPGWLEAKLLVRGQGKIGKQDRLFSDRPAQRGFRESILRGRPRLRAAASTQARGKK
jgi:hypothetical protein